MDVWDFPGHRRQLTWVRTPLHDRDYELTRVNSNPELGRKESKPASPDSKSRGRTLSIDRLRNVTWRFLRKKYATHTNGKAIKNGRKPSVPRKRDKEMWKIVHFVVGGQSFKSPEWIFQGHPRTLLGNLERRNLFFYAKQKSYVFPETLPDVFTAVLEYYQTGVLTRPERLTLNYFLEHVEIFDLEPEAIEALLAKEGVHRLESEIPEWITKRTLLSRIWDVMDNPWSSHCARLYSYLSLFLTVLSVILYIIETLPELEEYSLTGKTSLSDCFRSPITVVNTVCFFFFLIEFALRIISCPGKKLFLRTWTNWTDLFSIIPFPIALILLAVHSDSRETLSVSVLNVLRGCRLLLITRVLGTSRYYRQHWITILAQTLWNNIKTLFVLFFLLIICMVGFGGLIYAVEGVGETNPTFSTIPLGMWWAVITMTTVGYGDIAPKRAVGRIVALICGCVGLMFIGFVLESITYEYHRLMKSNSQYLRYVADVKERQVQRETKQPPLKRISTVRGSLAALSTLGHGDCDIMVSINGAEFLFSLVELNRHSSSLLGHPAKRAQYFNPVTGNYFFPRNQDIFPSIHQYYRDPTVPLKRPPFISMQRFVEEIEFFQLRPQAVIDFFASEGIRLMEEAQPTSKRVRYWHLVLEHYQYNIVSHIIMVISVLITACFVITIVLESLPSLLDPTCITALAPDSNGTMGHHGLTFSSYAYSSFSTGVCKGELAFFVVETICTLWFVLELLARFCVSPTKRAFLKKPMTWIDTLIVFPYIFTLIQLISVVSPSANVSRAFGFFRTMRLLRLVSVLKFSRYFKRIEMIFAIVQSTWSELLMLCYFMLINSTVFGTVAYIFEYDPDGEFNSIPQGMYWAWITMLTIGYGDIVPRTPMGKVVGTGCAILGIVFWTLPMTLISDHFANYRRLYEGQDYMMKCLTRMQHLRDSEAKKRATSKVIPAEAHLLCAPPLPDPDNSDEHPSRDASPRPLLSRLTARSSSKLSHVSRSHTDTEASQDEPLNFGRLQYDAFSGSRNKGSFQTIGSGNAEGFPQESVQYNPST